ncbi:glutamate--tRNA ligase family protein [Desulfosporosinus acidiphilus]|uniref:glutamate--tRNA ligase family protein n=1 Tax=Desulfosporosinus acidiphilus TaxID=885581 RepID=UPI000257B689|nr:glutamate--tRNA ligase family protein [Desulfosporosinus acidiphilus]
MSKNDEVYPCFCSRADIRASASAPQGIDIASEYTGTCRKLSSREVEHRKQREPYSLRFNLKPRTITFHDLCYGVQNYKPGKTLGDFIVRRRDGVHAYQLAVVVDDAMMNITHVLRGSDLLVSAARQIALFHALHWPIPEYAHVPILLGPDGHRLSKRHGDVSLYALRKAGIAPQQVVGWLGYWAGILPEPFPLNAQELIKPFSLELIPRHEITIDPKQFVGG